MNAALLPPDLLPHRIVATFGLISDTHMPLRFPHLPTVVYSIFDSVDVILHAGDMGELWVLDQLSAIAPVVAVHGNDETDEARQALPYQQIVAVGGHRLLLCHGHLPDRAAEMASRTGDDWRPKLAQRARQAHEVGARIMACNSHLGMRRWRGETEDLISMAELQAAIDDAKDFTDAERGELLELICRA